ncbi:PfkB family carbohydrate kinase [Tistrella mobilis]|uniref:PfkB family carbohydrate kinase n=1 Tax=Tistrella mobilis TaxID=171437 RepID=UPI003556F7AB
MPHPNRFNNWHVDVAGTGFTVLDRVYADGDLTDEALGGSCGNVLLSLAMLQRNVAPVLALGDDREGARLVDEFSQAGALVSYIHRRSGVRSPVLAQELDTTSGSHSFSFVCPETDEELPRYHPIGETELAFAAPVLTNCSVFYVDRLSESILEAMKMADSAGALIFFEPSDIQESHLFTEALSMCSILKYSEERLGERLAKVRAEYVRIVTYGAAGLEVCDASDTVWCKAFDAPSVLDTCGSGDMVSVGIIDWILANQFERTRLKASDLLRGVVAGQRLAAENCAYAGARGLFKRRGADHALKLLRGE